jgi:Skp family chaperone for outer membrane proteins
VYQQGIDLTEEVIRMVNQSEEETDEDPIEKAKTSMESGQIRVAVVDVNKCVSAYGQLVSPKELNSLVAKFARKHGIHLVVNLDSAAIDPKDPENVITRVNKRIVYWADRDISDHIIKLMKHAHEAGGAADIEATYEEKLLGGKIAVIDMSDAFKNNDSCAAQKARLQQEAVRFANYMQIRSSALEDLKSVLNALDEGTDAHENTFKQLARESAELSAEIELKNRELRRKEAMCYVQARNEIQGIVTRIARDRGIGLVIRFDRKPMEMDDRESLLRGVNRSVVFQHEIDITDDVIRQVNAASSLELR